VTKQVNYQLKHKVQNTAGSTKQSNSVPSFHDGAN